jgi:hypothetical protein
MEDPSVVRLREEVSLEWDNLIDLPAEPIHFHGSLSVICLGPES